MAERMCLLKGLDHPCIYDNCPIFREGERECGLTTLAVTLVNLLREALTEYINAKKKERRGL